MVAKITSELQSRMDVDGTTNLLDKLDLDSKTLNTESRDYAEDSMQSANSLRQIINTSASEKIVCWKF